MLKFLKTNLRKGMIACVNQECIPTALRDAPAVVVGADAAQDFAGSSPPRRNRNAWSPTRINWKRNRVELTNASRTSRSPDSA